MVEFSNRRAVAVSLVCASALVFQVFSTRILSVVLSEQLILFSISFALLGMGVAASLVSIGSKKSAIGDKGLSLLAVLLTASYLIAYYLSTQVSAAFNDQIEQFFANSNGRDLFDMLRGTMFSKMWLLGSILFIPYVVFGFFIALFFKSSDPSDYHRYYAADLIGAAAGSVLAMAVLDAWGFQGGFGLSLLTAAAAACLFAWRSSTPVLSLSIAALAGVLVVTAIPSTVTIFEARPSMRMLSRDFSGDRQASESWSRWNAHSRVARLDVRYPDGTDNEVYAHEGGDGWAFASSTKTDPMYGFAAVLKPKNILVMFAGVGADMEELDKACSGECAIAGVEINRQMVEHAIATRPLTREFLAKPNITLHVAEAREYLERDHARYDSILLSWWGAGASHFMGTSGQLAEYLYTKEALESLLDHLTPQGSIVIYNGSKVQLLASLATVFRERNLGDLDGRVIIMRPQNLVRSNSAGFYDTPESMRMIVKPSGFTPQEVEVIDRFANTVAMTVVLGPQQVMPGYEPYGELVSGASINQVNASLQDSGIEVSVPDDSRPFVNDLIPRAQYFNPSRLLFEHPGDSPNWFSIRNIFKFIITLSALSAILIIVPIAMKSGPRWSRRSLGYLVYFSAIGAGFMLLEVGILRKLGLLLGHPSYAISIVLASLILSTGVGSLLSPKFEDRGLTDRRIAVFVFLYVLAFLLLYPLTYRAIIALPFMLKAIIAVIVIFPLGVALGQFFPRGLRDAGRIDERLVPWAWAINGTLSTIASALAVYLSYPLGFDWIILLGGATYLLVLLVGRWTAGEPEPKPA